METAHRYELSDAQWKRIKPYLTNSVGRKADDNRRFLNAVLWVARSGAAWRDLPDHYGKWNTVFVRYNRWSKQGRWEKLWAALVEKDGLDLDWAALDSTIVRAHQHAAGQKKHKPMAV
jgi:transposase